ncbi:cytochrome b5 domain-containing protein [Candidatus Roizmanbacteria bacterium]|nr:cytochrome b5 domain-containing protein [Candidatus Roizmanbacteria bacterium]
MEFKKELKAGSIILVIAVLISLFYITRYPDKKTGAISFPTPTNAAAKKIATFSHAEVAKHNNVDDCWLMYQNNVYNVSDYLNRHPGGSNIIVPYCGKDATSAFLTKGGRGSHSQRAFQELESLRIGLVSIE